jgi:hypothetical protein
MKKYLTKTRVLLIGCIVAIISMASYLFFDAFYGDVHFRTMQDSISDAKGVDLTGLR